MRTSTKWTIRNKTSGNITQVVKKRKEMAAPHKTQIITWVKQLYR